MKYTYTDRAERARRGFTLLELIVVITIIGILGTLVVVRVSGYVPKTKWQKMLFDTKAIHDAAVQINLTTGKYPESIAEMVNPKDENGQPIPGGFDTMPKDPWKREYLYEMTDGKPKVTCLGSDNAQGGEGEGEAKDYTYPPEDGQQ
jgi:general secretion pathway protein G